MNNIKEYISEKLRINNNTKFVKDSESIITSADRTELIKGRDKVLQYLHDHSWFDSFASDFKVYKSDDDCLVLDLSRNKNAMNLINQITKELNKELDCACGIDMDKGIIEFVI